MSRNSLIMTPASNIISCSLSLEGLLIRERWRMWRKKKKLEKNEQLNQAMNHEEKTLTVEVEQRRNQRIASRQRVILKIDGREIGGWTSVVSTFGATIYLDNEDFLPQLEVFQEIEVRTIFSSYLPAQINDVRQAADNFLQTIIGLKLLGNHTWLE